MTNFFNLLRKKKPLKASEPKKLGIVLPLHANNRGLDMLVELVYNIRPKKLVDVATAETNFKAVLYQLQNDKSLLFSFRKSLLQLFLNADITSAITESGIAASRGFVQEFLSKIKHKILPPLQKENDFLYVLNRVFYKKRDFVWVEGIDKDLWANFFKIIGIQISISNPRIDNALLKSLHILSQRITTLALDKEICACFDNEENQLFPFFEQNRIINLWDNKMQTLHATTKESYVIGITESLYNCNQVITLVKNQRRQNGTSLSQTYTILQIQQLINRMFILLDVLDNNNEFNTNRFINYFYLVVQNECTKDSLREFLSKNLGMVAYQITAHKGRKGRLFITTTSKEFKHIVRSAMGGGFIITFIAIIKNLLNLLPVAPFTQGFYTSINYSAGFIIIDQTKSTLATKQPAYTASALASQLEIPEGETKPDFESILITMAKVSRSQIASFFGNLIIVFPLPFIIGFGVYELTGNYIIPVEAVDNLLAKQHPFQSWSLLYAAFTGVFLFLSGIISGYVENNLFYGKIPERIINHPRLFRNWKLDNKKKLANYINNHSGAITGSVALGFFLGMSSVFSKIFGLPFDIRHITISAANVSLAMVTKGTHISIAYLITIVFGVLLIGLINFLVSFSLAFYVALKSRGIRLRNYPELLNLLGKYFIKYPKDFILPAKGGRENGIF